MKLNTLYTPTLNALYKRWYARMPKVDPWFLASLNDSSLCYTHDGLVFFFDTLNKDWRVYPTKYLPTLIKKEWSEHFTGADACTMTTPLILHNTHILVYRWDGGEWECVWCKDSKANRYPSSYPCNRPKFKPKKPQPKPTTKPEQDEDRVPRLEEFSTPPPQAVSPSPTQENRASRVRGNAPEQITHISQIVLPKETTPAKLPSVKVPEVEAIEDKTMGPQFNQDGTITI